MLAACCLTLTKAAFHTRERSEKTGRKRKLVGGYTFAVTKIESHCYAAGCLRLRCPINPNIGEHMSASDMGLNLMG
jgi:hypothetical protein